MTTVPDTERQVPVDDLNRARTAEESGGGKRTYTRDPEGTSTGGQFTADPGGSKTTPKPPTKTTPKAKSSQDYKPIVPVKAKTGPMKLGGDNDPQQVKQLQALLGALGLGTPPTNGSFDQATKDAVMEAQRRLGIKPTGRASTALLRKLTDTYALSPCVKRSEDTDREFEIFRAAVNAGDFDDPEEDSDDKEMTTPMSLEWGYSLLRSFPIEDLNVRGDGRTVEAYAAIYDMPTEIHDAHGDYMEVVARSAFDRMLSRWNSAQERPVVLYNHGMTMHGTPSDVYSVPIGVPMEIRNDQKGLFTVTRYNEGEDADRILRAIDNGAITGYSFRGRIYQSNPSGRPGKARPGKALPTITRTELGLSDFGPTPTPYYKGAAITAVRSATQLAAELDQLSDEDRYELIARYNTTPQDSVEDATPDVGLGAADSPLALRSAADIRRRIRVAKLLKGMQ